MNLQVYMNDPRIKTIFCDIDGTLIRHPNHPSAITINNPHLDILPGVLDRLKEWDGKGYNIILVTGRKESLREETEKALKTRGVFYDQLIMGLGGGPRYLINDLNPDYDNPSATAINVKRDVGLEDVKI